MTWKDIPGFPSYQVNEIGQVRSLKGKDPKLMKPTIHDGYWAFYPSYGRKDKRRLFSHVAVLSAFIGPMPEWAECIRHLNGDRTDNRISNLCYGTHSENSQDMMIHNPGLRAGENNGRAKVTKEQALEIRKRRASGEKPTLLASEFDLNYSTVWRICTNRLWPSISEERVDTP